MAESRHVASLVATHTQPEDMDRLIETLRDHGLTPDMARRCIAGMLRYNQQNAAATYDFDVATAKRYRDAFQAMDDEVFWTVVATIAHRRLNDITDNEIESVQKRGEDSE